MSIIEITTRCSVYGESSINRYHYATAGNGTPYALFCSYAIEDWRTFIEAEFRILLPINANVRLQDVKLRSLYDPTDFMEYLNLNLAGTGTVSEPLPSSYALGVRSDRMETGRRRGYKRVGGIGEGDVAGNTLTAGMLIKVAAWCTKLGNIFTVTAPGEVNQDMQPVVLKLQKTVGVPPAPNTYAPFTTESAQRANMMFPDIWNFQMMTTQNSRRPGRGI